MDLEGGREIERLRENRPLKIREEGINEGDLLEVGTAMACLPALALGIGGVSK